MTNLDKHEILDRVSIIADGYTRFIAEPAIRIEYSDTIQLLIQDIEHDLHELYQLLSQDYS